MPAVTFRFRAEWRARRRAWLGLALLVGAVAGTSLVLLAGARRTGSAHERFLAAQRAFDVGLAVPCGDGEHPGPGAAAGCLGGVARLPAVRDATTVSVLPAFVETADGGSLQPDASDPCYSGPGQVATVFDRSGRWGTAINRARFVAGRAARPDAADEVVISRETARRLQLGVGSELRVRLLAGEDCLAAPSSWQPPRRVRVVGVQLSPGQVRPPSGQYLQTVEVTPAFAQRFGQVRDRIDFLMVRLREGTSVDTLRAEARRAGHDSTVLAAQADTARAVERAVRPSEVSLTVLAVLTALAGAVVLGQVLVRHASSESGDDQLLTALGMRARDRAALAALRGGSVGLLSAGIAVALAVAASPLMPVGLAREVEPARGVSVDGFVLGLGALATVVFVGGVTLAAAARAGTRRVRTLRARPAALAGAAARAGLSPAAVSGARFALERGSGSAAVPVVSSFAGVTIAVAAVVGALTFGAGLQHLRVTPRLVGWNWDLVLAYPEPSLPGAPSPDEVQRRVRTALAARGLEDVGMATIWSPFPQGRDLQLGPDHLDAGGFIAFDGTARVGPSVISGRKPAAADEILLGPRTLAALGLHVGDRVDVVGQAGTWDAPGPETSTRMRIVGTGLAPMTESLGRGAAVTIAGLRELNRGAREQAWFVRLERGTARRTAIDAFEAAFPGALRKDITPFEYEKVGDPGLNLEQIGSVPALFAVIMAVMAAAVLAHVLAVAARVRRRDLAVLRVLGFSRGQVVRTIVWQSTVYVLGAVLIGSPAGVALGRLAWRVYATNLGVVPEAVTPWTAWLAVVASAVALAGLVAITPAVRGARSNPASVLRSE